MTFCDAIERHEIISFDYQPPDDATSGFYIVHPYTYGLDRKGHYTILGWLVLGPTSEHIQTGSTAGKKPGWRTFHAFYMNNILGIGEFFDEIQPSFAPDSDQFTIRYCQIL